MNKKQIQERRVTFSKRWTAIILFMSCIWITLSYILAFLGKEQIAETLSETVANVIIFSFVPYLCKAYFETYANEKNKLKEKELEIQEQSQIDPLDLK